MNIIIEKAGESDIDALSRFYDEVNDYLASHINYPEWKRGIYPARDTAENAILEGTCLLYTSLAASANPGISLLYTI